MGKQAVIIHATTDSKTEAEGVLDDGIYRLRNAGSGLYMTVADGVDADERNLIQDAADGTAAQEFRISMIQTGTLIGCIPCVLLAKPIEWWIL